MLSAADVFFIAEDSFVRLPLVTNERPACARECFRALLENFGIRERSAKGGNCPANRYKSIPFAHTPTYLPPKNTPQLCLGIFFRTTRRLTVPLFFLSFTTAHDLTILGLVFGESISSESHRHTKLGLSEDAVPVIEMPLV